MRAEKKIEHLMDWVTPDRLWDFILAASLPGRVLISDDLRDTIIDNVLTIEEESRDPDDDQE